MEGVWRVELWRSSEKMSQEEESQRAKAWSSLPEVQNCQYTLTEWGESSEVAHRWRELLMAGSRPTREGWGWEVTHSSHKELSPLCTPVKSAQDERTEKPSGELQRSPTDSTRSLKYLLGKSGNGS